MIHLNLNKIFIMVRRINLSLSGIYIYLLFIIAAIFSNPVSAQNVMINEVMSGNATTIRDEDKDYSDWIELYNPGTSRSVLKEYYLSDKKNTLKWQLPDIGLEPGEFLLLYASDKNRKEYTTWRTAIEWGDIWKYFAGLSEPDSNWKSLQFNELNWQEGPTGIGFGNGDDSTEIPQAASLYVRKKFFIDDVDKLMDMKLILDYDDGYVAYINGLEVDRKNLGSPGEMIPYDRPAYWNREGRLSRGIVPQVSLLKDFISFLQNGENVIAIQVHNSLTKLDSDITCIPLLFLGYKEGEVPQGRLVNNLFKDSVITRFLHTNFELSANGEKLYLYDGNLNTIDYLDIPSLYVNNAFGRFPDGSSNYYIFSESTPGYANSLRHTVSSDIDDPVFSMQGGFYQDSVVVHLSHKDPNVKIYYTINNSDPVDTSILYSAPIHINKTTVIKARAYSGNFCSKVVITNTYLINENTLLPVVSLSSDPKNLTAAKTGIFANVWEDWERPVHTEFFEIDKSLAFSLNAGIRITGNGSRDFDQRSLVIFARDKYDDKDIDYQIFQDKPITNFKAIIFRNGGNDWLKTLFRDGLMHEIAKGTNIDLQAYRPAIVFINGAYYGISEIRERLNEDYVAGNYNLDRDSIYIIKPEYQSGPRYEGRENQVYSDLQDFVYGHDLRDSINFSYVLSQIDVENFIDHNAAEVYYNNYDWPILNTRIWRPKREGGRWRWILCDTDFGFGFDFWSRGIPEYDDDMLGILLDTTSYFNPPRSSRIFRGLIKNEKFRNAFISRFADLLNTNFTPGAVTPIITKFRSAIENEIPRHKSRWAHSAKNWNSEVNILYEFAEKRSPYVREHLVKHFGLEGIYTLNINSLNEDEGFIKINTIEVKNLPWEGIYFKNLPVELTAIPKPGYLFAGWSDKSFGMINPIKITAHEDFNISAKFIKNNIPGNSIVINEINYKSSAAMNTEDWIELYNSSDSTVNLYGWEFSDSDSTHNYEIPSNTIIAPKGYLVLCREKNAFSSVFPNLKNVAGSFNFGLDNKGEKLVLKDASGLIMDSLSYSNKGEWPAQADGEGYTLELKNCNLDNSLADSWAACKIKGGTPGEVNSVDDAGINSIPKVMTLYQNYPNPFNSGTTIRYSIPEAGKVYLTIYDNLGQKIIESGRMQNQPGNGEFQLDNKNLNALSSGVYFYRLHFGEYAETKKMILLR